MTCLCWIFLTRLVITHGHLRPELDTGRRDVSKIAGQNSKRSNNESSIGRKFFDWVNESQAVGHHRPQGRKLSAENTEQTFENGSANAERGICVMIRACQRDRLLLPVLLTELCNAQMKQTDGFYQFQFFVFSTDDEKKLDGDFIDAAKQALESTPCAGSMEKLSWPNGPQPSNETFGYDMTNLAYAEILGRERTRTHPQCAYFITTNADNMYNEHLFESTEPLLRERNDLVCFDFVLNHRRGRPGHVVEEMTFFQLLAASARALFNQFTGFLGIGSRNQTIEKIPRQVVSVGMQREFVDLGSCFVSGKIVKDLFTENNGSVFKPYSSDSSFYGGWYSSDWSFYEQILKRVPRPSVELVHEVLQIHQ